MKDKAAKTDGILPVNKPKNITSYDVIRILKRRAVFQKIGHAGTLDPMAEGVLLILIGRATKLFGKINGLKKTYTAEIAFGFETDTDDTTGKTVSRSDKRPTRCEAEEILRSFLGEIEQVPPSYSAVKYGGKALYKYARKGALLNVAAKKVKIYSIEIISFSGESMALRIECSGGTYIRSLARDFGRKAGSFATLSALRREKIGSIDVSMCAGMDKIKNGSLDDLIIGINEKSNNAWLF